MKNIKIEVKWSIIFMLMTLVWMKIEQLAGFHDTRIDQHAIMTNFILIPFIIIYVLALNDKRKNFYNGNMSYKQGFVTGFIIALIVAVLSPLTQYLISSYISPDYFTNAIAYAVDTEMMTQEKAEAYFNLNSYMIQSAIGSVVMGTILSAIVAIFTKSKKVQ